MVQALSEIQMSRISMYLCLPDVSSFLRLGWLASYLSPCSLLSDSAFCNLQHSSSECEVLPYHFLSTLVYPLVLFEGFIS